MRISDLARRTGTPTTTLRHYERLGLLRPTRAPNGYRDYPESAVREVIFIAMARQIGIGLKRIAEHLPAYRTGRLRAEQRFSLAAMVGAYQGLYDRLLAGHRRPG